MSIPSWEEAAESESWENLPQDLHEQAVKDYLGSNGDAIDGRVQTLIGLADTLYKSGHHGPSIVASVIALEVMIHYFCVRPIVVGAILSDLVATEVSKRIVGSRSSDQRQMLSAVLRPWGIELPQLLLPDQQRKRQSQTVLTIWLTEILPGVFRQSARPSRVAHLVRSADGLIGPARGFAR